MAGRSRRSAAGRRNSRKADPAPPNGKGAPPAIPPRATRDLALLAALVLVGLALRAQNLAAPFFYDEAVYVNLAQHPLHSDFYPDPIFFRHPPAHQFLLAAWGRVAGYSEVVMRLPSLLFAAATVALTYLLGRRLVLRGAAFAAAALLVFSILHQRYSQAATMYAMATFFVTLCAYGLICDSERLVAAGFLGAIYTHYFGFYLAPSLLLFYSRRYDGDWRRIAGRLALYAAAYAPWIAIAAEGMTFHAGRSGGPQGWAFHWGNLLRQLSLALLGGNLYVLYAWRRQEALQPALLPCGLFLLSAPFLIPFQRYLLPFLPLLIIFGVAGMLGLFQVAVRHFRIETAAGRAALAGLGLLALGVPNLEAYGIYPAMGRHLDWRDAIHAQEWDRVIAAIPSGRIATSNARSLVFYGNLRGVRTYDVVHQFAENPAKFATLVERAENDWIVVSKDPLYAAMLPIADGAAHYERAAEFDYTVVYRKSGR